MESGALSMFLSINQNCQTNLSDTDVAKTGLWSFNFKHMKYKFILLQEIA